MKNHRKLVSLLLALMLGFAFVAAPATAQTCSFETAGIFDAMTTVTDLNVPVERALLVELAAAMTSLAAGDTEAVTEDLEAFIAKVETQAGKQIDADAAAELIALAQSVLDGPPSCPCSDFYTAWNDFVTQQPILGAFSIPSPAPVLVLETPVYSGGFGIRVDSELDIVTPTGFACGGNEFDTTPLTAIPLNTQAELDSCITVMENYFSEYNCPAEGGLCNL